MDLLLFELRLACRRLGRRKGHAVLIFATFALSIALALLSWTLFSAVFLRHPDFDPKGSLHVLLQIGPDGRSRERAFLQEMEAWAVQQQVFSEFGPIKQPRAMLAATPEGNERLSATFLSTAALRMLRAQPLHGRLFVPEEDLPGSAPAVLLSHGFWQRHYGGDPGVIGRSLRVDGFLVAIVGVMPASFRFPYEQDLWVSLGFDPTSGRMTAPVFDILVRLRPGVTVFQAESELARIAANTRDATGRRELKPVLVPLNDVYLSAALRSAAFVLFALSGVFVLMSCTNTANLMLIDVLSRTEELGASTALGVPRIAIVRSAFWQILLLASLATGAAIVAVRLAAPLVFEIAASGGVPYWIVLSWGADFWGVACAIGAASAGAAIVAPAILVLSTRAQTLTRAGLSGGRGSARHGWRRGLLIAQVALLTLLGCGTGLLVKSLSRIADIDPGFDPSNVLTFRLALASEEIQGIENRRRAFENVLEEIRRHPDIRHVALSSGMPGVGGGAEVIFDVDRAVVADRSGTRSGHLQVITDEFFSALKLRWVSGESFSRVPVPGGPDFAIVTRSLAGRLWPDQDPIGRVFYVRQRSDVRGRVRELTVRGVVEDLRAANFLSEGTDTIYTHISRDGHLSFNLFVRGAQLTPSAEIIRQTIRRADPRISASEPAPLIGRIERSVAMLRLTARIAVAFTVAAALLGALGIYSLTMSLMMQRNREFGIRLALGSTPRRLWTYFTREHLTAASIGLGAGLTVAAMASPVLAALLYRVSAYDYAVFAAVAVGVSALAFLSCLPSWTRIRKVNPADCLRSL